MPQLALSTAASPAPAHSTLSSLNVAVRACRRCKLRARCKRPVIGVGKAHADVMFVGQAPGWQEDRDGIAFIGQAGQFQAATRERLGLKSVYDTNCAKCYPGKQRGGDREPPQDAMDACLVHLEAEIALVKPKLIVAVGAISMRHFGITGGIMQNSGKVFPTKYGPVMPIMHPAMLMRRPNEAWKYRTSMHAILTHLAGGTTPPLHGGKIVVRGLLGLDIEVQDEKIWSLGVSDGDQRGAVRWGKSSLPKGVVPVGHNMKYDMRYLGDAGWKFSDWHDSILLAHMLGHQPLNLKDLSAIFLGGTYETFREVTEGRRFEDVPEMLDYNSKDAWASRKLYDVFMPQVRAGGWEPHYQFEKTITPVLIEMERGGMPVDQDRLKILNRQLLARMAQAEKILRSVGIEDPHKRDVVAEKLWRRKSKIETTKTGKLSTKADDLRKNAAPDQLPWVNALTDWYMADKFRSTYLSAWRGQEFLHPSLNQTGAANWRFSCSNPNLQNVSKKKFSDGEKVQLYHLFVAPPGYTLISADASQIELRQLANLVLMVTGDRTMADAYLAGRDLHDETSQIEYVIEASKRLGIDVREISKRTNFGIAYLIMAYGLSRLLNAPEKTTQGIIDAWYAAYPGVRPFQEEMASQASKHGYIKLWDGMPLWIPGLAAEEGKLYTHGLAQAANFPISGGAAKVVRMAMLRCREFLRMQVHDELLWLVPTSKVKDYTEFLKTELHKPYIPQFEVPYTWDIKVGQSWGEIKKLPEFVMEDDSDDE